MGAAMGLSAARASAQDGAAPARPAPRANEITIDADGTFHLPAQAIPMSSLMSPELKESLLHDTTLARDPKYTERQPDGSTLMHKVHRDRQAALYPVQKDDTKVGGVHVFVFTPKDGPSPKNRNRVLIELHSAGCWTDCAQLGSQPIAYLGKIKVVAVDYREPQFPSAVEDVTNVYAALLKTYRPQNIGIYGCSRGGVLVARSLAWFQKHKLPRPAAAGILCASAGGDRGDSGYLGNELGNGNMTRGGPQVDRDLGDIDPNDPLAAPINSPDVLSKFPPTLMVTGTRGVELSTAVYTHAQLVKLGVEADLHVFEGGRHSFWYDPAPPESKQVYDIIVKFFDRHLGRPAGRPATPRTTTVSKKD
jgi:acetyl esterase/lipase